MNKLSLFSLCIGLSAVALASAAGRVADGGAPLPPNAGQGDGGPAAAADDGPAATADGAVADAGAPPPAPTPQPPPPPPPPVAEVPRLTLRGLVLGRGNREPLAGASITIDAVPAAETDSQGRFEVQVAPGPRRLQIQQPGYQTLAATVDAASGADGDRTYRLTPRLSGERYETVVSPPDERASRTSLRDEELRQVAGSFGDPFRVIESLPGVSQVVWPAAIYAIRGANPGNTGFFLDGVRVPALFHFALGPSVIHPFFLQQVDFYPGGYPASYGRYISGIVSARTANPPTDRTHASVDLRAFDAGGIVATPLDGGRGSLAVAGRFSYTGLLFSALSTDLVFTYWDYQLRVEHQLGPGRITLFALGSGDLLRGKSGNSLFQMPGMIGPSDQPPEANLSFHRLDLRWDGTVLGGRLAGSALVGTDSSTTTLQEIVSFPVHVATLIFAPRLSYAHRLAAWADMETGADVEAQRFRPTAGLPDAADRMDLFRQRDVVSSGAFVGFTLRAGSWLTMAPALRYERFSEQDVVKLEPSPRLTVRVRPAGDVWIKASAGRYAQMASLPVAVPGFEGFGLDTYGTQTSLQGSLGVEAAFGPALTFELTGFYQRLRLTDLQSIFMYDPERPDVVATRDGESYGMEVLLRRSLTKRLYGWIAYTLSRSDRLVGYYRVKAASDWDQRHIFNVVLGYRFHGGWAASGRVHYNTGRPYPVSDDRSFRVDYERLPPFFQLDLRVDRQFVFDRFVLSAYLELVNTTLSREVFALRRQSDGTRNEDGYRIVLPSLGLHAEW